MPRKHAGALTLKLRVRTTERMTKGTMLRRLRRTLDTGTLQPGIELDWIDWASRKTGKLHEGMYLGADAEEALYKFFHALVDAGTAARIAVVDKE